MPKGFSLASSLKSSSDKSSPNEGGSILKGPWSAEIYGPPFKFTASKSSLSIYLVY